MTLDLMAASSPTPTLIITVKVPAVKTTLDCLPLKPTVEVLEADVSTVPFPPALPLLVALLSASSTAAVDLAATPKSLSMLAQEALSALRLAPSLLPVTVVRSLALILKNSVLPLPSAPEDVWVEVLVSMESALASQATRVPIVPLEAPSKKLMMRDSREL